MSTTWQSDPSIPAPVREGLTHFCDQLRIAAGDKLVSVLLYGGLARAMEKGGRLPRVKSRRTLLFRWRWSATHAPREFALRLTAR